MKSIKIDNYCKISYDRTGYISITDEFMGRTTEIMTSIDNLINALEQIRDEQLAQKNVTGV